MKKAPAAKKAPAKKTVKKAKSPFGKKFIGEMKARLEEERAKYLHSEETYRAEADALIEGVNPATSSSTKSQARVTRLRWSVNATLRCPTRRAKPSSRSTPHSAASRPVRTASVSPQGSRSLKSASVRSRGRRARRVQGWRTRQPSLSRLGPTRLAMNDQHLIETLPEAFHGERIDRAVSAIAISRSLAKELIVGSKVVVDGRPITTASRKVDAGMVVTIELPPPDDPTPAPQVDVEFTVVHEDDDVIVVDKPAGLVVHPGPGRPMARS